MRPASCRPRALAAATAFGLAIPALHAQPADRCLDRVAAYEAAPPLLPGDTLHLTRAGGGALLYLGTDAHTTDPAHSIVGRIDRAVVEFRPTVVFYEGPDRGVRETGEGTIRAVGESGYARFAAASVGARLSRLEPSPDVEFAAVADALGAERAALFFVLREAARLRDRRALAGDDLRSAVAALLTRIAGAGLPLPFTTLDALDIAYRSNVPQGPANWEDVPGAWFDPLSTDPAAGFFPAANRASSTARNRHMVEVLAAAVEAGERALAVVGRNHLPMQAGALRCRLVAP